MNRIEQTFGRSRVLLPVIHPIGRTEALASVELAVAAGVAGIFLINQGMSTSGHTQMRIWSVLGSRRGLACWMAKSSSGCSSGSARVNQVPIRSTRTTGPSGD